MGTVGLAALAALGVLALAVPYFVTHGSSGGESHAPVAAPASNGVDDRLQGMLEPERRVYFNNLMADAYRKMLTDDVCDRVMETCRAGRTNDDTGLWVFRCRNGEAFLVTIPRTGDSHLLNCRLAPRGNDCFKYCPKLRAP